MMNKLLLFLIILLIKSAIYAEISGSGATLPNPLYQAWIKTYETKTDKKVTYDSIGSENGFKQFYEKSVDFYASDINLTKSLIQSIPSTPNIIQFPVLITGVAIIYHLPMIQTLYLDHELLTSILLGKIKYWDNASIKNLNPETELPHLRIIPILRKGNSGTSYVLSQYLNQVNHQWQEKIGISANLGFKTGFKVDNSIQMAEAVSQIPGSIGYISLGYTNNSTVASIKNQSGNFVKPTKKNIQKAVKNLSEEAIFCSNTTHEEGYPLSTFSWITIYQEQSYNDRSLQIARELKKWIHWVIENGQDQMSNKEYYIKLPNHFIQEAKEKLTHLTYQEKSF